jgi:hypothetical protein
MEAKGLKIKPGLDAGWWKVELKKESGENFRTHPILTLTTKKQTNY